MRSVSWGFISSVLDIVKTITLPSDCHAVLGHDVDSMVVRKGISIPSDVKTTFVNLSPDSMFDKFRNQHLMQTE